VIALLIGLVTIPAFGHDCAPNDDRATDEISYYFYNGRDYGSESLIHPLRLIINGGFGILQVENRSNRLSEVNYRQGLRNVWRNLKDPFTAIRVNGWKEFASRELVPLSFNSGKAYYWPNYMNHLIGGGMSYRMMVDWFNFHDYPRPRIWAGATIFAYHFLNEVVENDNRDGWSTDAIADLYIFDPLSIWLFSSDRVARFFSSTLSMADWSFQPILDPRTSDLHNVGQNFAVRWPFPWSQRWKLFYHWGSHGELGLSYTWREEHTLSAAAGMKARNLIELGPISSVDLVASAGMFYDRNNSLIASVMYARTDAACWSFNLYPGLLRLGPAEMGLSVLLARNGELTAGITLATLKCLPFGYASQF
jgi:hypothetical protein